MNETNGIDVLTTGTLAELITAHDEATTAIKVNEEALRDANWRRTRLAEKIARALGLRGHVVAQPIQAPRRKRSVLSQKDVLLQLLKGGGQPVKCKDLIKATGIPSQSISACLSELAKTGLVVRTGVGEYRAA